MNNRKFSTQVRENIFRDCERGDTYRDVGNRYGMYWETARKIYRAERLKRGMGEPEARKRGPSGNAEWKRLSDDGGYAEQWHGTRRSLCDNLGLHYVERKPEPHICLECGKPLSGDNKTSYCALCGESRVETFFYQQGHYLYENTRWRQSQSSI